VGLLGIGSSENASLGFVDETQRKNQRIIKIPVPDVGVKKIKCFFGGSQMRRRCVRECLESQGHDGVCRDVDGWMSATMQPLMLLK
jgi:hypothetical protein